MVEPRILQISNFLVSEIPVAYHATSEYNAQKILEFGFDLYLSGQNCRKRFHNDPDITLTDYLAIETETRLENNVINTMIDYQKCRGCSNHILKITLKQVDVFLKISCPTAETLAKIQENTSIFVFKKDFVATNFVYSTVEGKTGQYRIVQVQILK